MNKPEQTNKSIFGEESKKHTSDKTTMQKKIKKKKKANFWIVKGKNNQKFVHILALASPTFSMNVCGGKKSSAELTRMLWYLLFLLLLFLSLFGVLFIFVVCLRTFKSLPHACFLVLLLPLYGKCNRKWKQEHFHSYIHIYSFIYYFARLWLPPALLFCLFEFKKQLIIEFLLPFWKPNSADS